VAATSEENGIPEAWSEDAPVLAGLAAASVQGWVALGPRGGARVQRHGDAPDDVEPITPGPRINLVLYYGVLAPRAPWRAEIVASAIRPLPSTAAGMGL
jgi:hypothetical protein